jgi:hypothetical protein
MIVPARSIITTNVDKPLRRQDLLRRNRTVERNRIDRTLFNVYKRCAVLQAKAERGVRILAVAFWTAFHKRDEYRADLPWDEAFGKLGLCSPELMIEDW